jgi:hypothetical protein
VSGTSDLDELLRDMQPTRRDGEFVFVDAGELPPGLAAEATVREPEGPSAVVDRRAADDAGLTYEVGLAWITLMVHSALEAVGLTAAVATELADRGISCNIVAGLRHDHLLVPATRADEALDALEGLAARAAAGHDPGSTAP